MSYEYFGVVTKVMGSRDGELRGLARFEKGDRDLHFNPERHFEPLGNVFVRRLPSDLRVGSPVLFDGQLNPRPVGRDAWWVTPGESGFPRIELHGFIVLSAAVSVVDLAAARPELRKDRLLANGARLYLRYETKHGACLRGPWTVKDGTLHADESELYEWIDRSWRAEDHFSAPDGTWEVLLSPLEPSLGEPLDLMSGNELAAWFLKQAEGGIPQLAESIGQLHRKTKTLLKAEFGELGQEAERRLFEARFSRVVSILETLELGRSELERITKAPAFQRLWQEALKLKAGELEAGAKSSLRELDSQQEAIRKGISQLRHQHQELEIKVERLRAREKGGRADLKAIEKKRIELENYIGQNHHRLLNDVRSLVPLLPGRFPVPGGVVQPPATIPALENREPGIPAMNGLRSVTIQACCLTLLLDPFFAREFAAQQGWRMFVLQVEPHWLCFDDAWRAGLRSIFEAAVGNDTMTLLHLQDLDRSPPELWLRPVLDLASGLRDGLIEGQRRWPETFRITASLAPGSPRHPLGSWLLCHFATPEPAGEQPGEGVGSDRTRQPRGTAAGAEPESLGAAGLEPFVEREVKIVTEMLAKQSEPGAEEDCSRFEARAREIRRDWPLTFARWP